MGDPATTGSTPSNTQQPDESAMPDHLSGVTETAQPVADDAPARAGSTVGSWIRRHRGWSTAGAVVVVLGLTALVDWPHQATNGQLQSDLGSYVTQIRADVLSCGVEVEDSLSAYNQIRAGVSTDRSTAIEIFDRTALDCTPAGNDKIVDLGTLEPPRSLARFHLDQAAQQLYGWAYLDAVDAMGDLKLLLTNPGDPATLSDLRKRLGDMQQRAVSAQGIFDSAATSVGAQPIGLSLDSIRPEVLVG